MKGPKKQGASSQEIQLGNMAADNAREAADIRQVVQSPFLQLSRQDNSDNFRAMANADGAKTLNNTLAQVNPNNTQALGDVASTGANSLSKTNVRANASAFQNRDTKKMNALNIGKGQQTVAMQGAGALARIQNNEMIQQMQRDQQKRAGNLNALASVTAAGFGAYQNNSGVFADGKKTGLDSKTNADVISGRGWLGKYGSGNNKASTTEYDLKQVITKLNGKA